MQIANIIKVTVLATATLWLAGCASTGGESTSGTEAAPAPEVNEVTVEVQPVVDPMVQAVIDTGEIDATPAEIENLLEQKTYHFAFDSAKLKSSDYEALDVQAAYLKSQAGSNQRIVIKGYTDERGTRTYNLALGERRANSVKNYLVAKGVSAKRIEVVSFGSEKPVNPAHNPTAWAENRRAVIVVE